MDVLGLNDHAWWNCTHMNASKERKRGAPMERMVGGDALPISSGGIGAGAGASSSCAYTIATFRAKRYMSITAITREKVLLEEAMVAAGGRALTLTLTLAKEQHKLSRSFSLSRVASCG